MNVRCPKETWATHYEALRAKALGRSPGGASERGVRLIQQQGVPGWMAAWKQSPPVPKPSSTPPSEAQPVLRSELGVELAGLLAEMMLRRFQGIRP